MKPKFNIVPYSGSLENKLMVLEKESVQGSLLKLEMKREQFLDRSVVFDKYKVYVSLSDQQDLQGVFASAIVPISINNELLNVGFGYDLRVSKKWRHKGLARVFEGHMIKHFMAPLGINKFCATSKKVNTAVHKATRAIKYDWGKTEFLYLTIPTVLKIKKINSSERPTRFSASIFNKTDSLKSLYTQRESGLGVFHTHKMYCLKVRQVSPIIKFGLQIRNTFNPTPFIIPSSGDVLKFASLFDITRENISDIPEVLKELNDQGIQFCNVVCSENDFIHSALHKHAINSYKYYLIHSFHISEQDEIIIDVRCL